MEYTPEETTQTNLQTETQPTLSNGFTLFKEGLQYAWNNQLFIVGIFLLPGFLILASSLENLWMEMPLLALISAIGVIASLIFYVFTIGAVYYHVALQGDIKSAYAWSKKNVFKLIWINVLVSLAAMGGFLLLLIPGFFILGLIYFAPFEFIHENKRGLQALLGSRAIVAGKWWSVAFRFLAFFLCAFLIMFVVGILVAVLLYLVPTPQADAVSALLFQLAGAFIMVATIYANSRLYTECKDLPQKASLSAGTTKYKILITLGTILMIISFFSGVIEGMSGESNKKMEVANNSVLRTELVAIAAIIEERYENTGTYIGACESALPFMSGEPEIVCNESVGAWAMTAVTEFESWCIDSTGYNKLQNAPLENQTQCLPDISL